jgi:hypothetical protein
VHAKVESERLGHGSIGIKLDTCSHMMPGTQEEAAERIDAGLRLRWREEGERSSMDYVAVAHWEPAG